MPRIVVSFKNTEEDLNLYDEIMKASDRSAYVKDILKAYKRMTEPKQVTETESVPVKRFVRVRGLLSPSKEVPSDTKEEVNTRTNIEENSTQFNTKELPKKEEVKEDIKEKPEVNSTQEEPKVLEGSQKRRRSSRLSSYDY